MSALLKYFHVDILEMFCKNEKENILVHISDVACTFIMWWQSDIQLHVLEIFLIQLIYNWFLSWQKYVDNLCFRFQKCTLCLNLRLRLDE